MSDFVYLDNAATTFPKPPEVIQFMCDFYSARGVNPGRTGFDLALEAEETLAEARQALTDFFGGTECGTTTLCREGNRYATALAQQRR